MKRSRLPSLFAALGLGLGACEHEGERSVAPPVDAEPPEEPDLHGVEPSGLGHDPKPATQPEHGASKPHLEGVPTQFCHAQLNVLARSLLRTESFLQAWNELASFANPQVSPDIPTTEFDARFALCGAQQRCSSDAPMVVEATTAYMVETGVLLPSEAGMLVIPGLGDPHPPGTCASDTVAIVEQHGPRVHVRATNRTRRYDYVHMHGYGAYGYGRIPGDCITELTNRRDLLVDSRSGTIALQIDQTQAGEGVEPWIEITVDAHAVTISGCGDVLELQWTD